MSAAAPTAASSGARPRPPLLAALWKRFQYHGLSSPVLLNNPHALHNDRSRRRTSGGVVSHADLAAIAPVDAAAGSFLRIFGSLHLQDCRWVTGEYAQQNPLHAESGNRPLCFTTELTSSSWNREERGGSTDRLLSASPFYTTPGVFPFGHTAATAHEEASIAKRFAATGSSRVLYDALTYVRDGKSRTLIPRVADAATTSSSQQDDAKTSNESEQSEIQSTTTNDPPQSPEPTPSATPSGNEDGAKPRPAHPSIRQPYAKLSKPNKVFPTTLDDTLRYIGTNHRIVALQFVVSPRSATHDVALGSSLGIILPTTGEVFHLPYLQLKHHLHRLTVILMNPAIVKVLHKHSRDALQRACGLYMCDPVLEVDAGTCVDVNQMMRYLYYTANREVSLPPAGSDGDEPCTSEAATEKGSAEEAPRNEGAARQGVSDTAAFQRIYGTSLDAAGGLLSSTATKLWACPRPPPQYHHANPSYGAVRQWLVNWMEDLGRPLGVDGMLTATQQHDIASGMWTLGAAEVPQHLWDALTSFILESVPARPPDDPLWATASRFWFHDPSLALLVHPEDVVGAVTSADDQSRPATVAPDIAAGVSAWSTASVLDAVVVPRGSDDCGYNAAALTLDDVLGRYRLSSTDPTGTFTKHVLQPGLIPFGTEVHNIGDKSDYWRRLVTEGLALETEFKEKGVVKTDETTPVIVNTLDALYAMLEDLKGVTEVAMDTEYVHVGSYAGCVALIQLSSPRGTDFIIDAYHLHDVMFLLNVVTLDPSIVKWVHGGRLDVVWCRRDLGINFVALCDTGVILNEMGGEGMRSLGSQLTKYFGVGKSKELSRSDWRQRPLPDTLVVYAANDTRYSLKLARLLVVSAARWHRELYTRDPNTDFLSGGESELASLTDSGIAVMSTVLRRCTQELLLRPRAAYDYTPLTAITRQLQRFISDSRTQLSVSEVGVFVLLLLARDSVGRASDAYPEAVMSHWLCRCISRAALTKARQLRMYHISAMARLCNSNLPLPMWDKCFWLPRLVQRYSQRVDEMLAPTHCTVIQRGRQLGTLILSLQKADRDRSGRGESQFKTEVSRDAVDEGGMTTERMLELLNAEPIFALRCKEDWEVQVATKNSLIEVKGREGLRALAFYVLYGKRTNLCMLGGIPQLPLLALLYGWAGEQQKPLLGLIVYDVTLIKSLAACAFTAHEGPIEAVDAGLTTSVDAEGVENPAQVVPDVADDERYLAAAGDDDAAASAAETRKASAGQRQRVGEVVRKALGPDLVRLLNAVSCNYVRCALTLLPHLEEGVVAVTDHPVTQTLVPTALTLLFNATERSVIDMQTSIRLVHNASAASPKDIPAKHPNISSSYAEFTAYLVAGALMAYPTVPPEVAVGLSLHQSTIKELYSGAYTDSMQFLAIVGRSMLSPLTVRALPNLLTAAMQTYAIQDDPQTSTDAAEETEGSEPSGEQETAGCQQKQPVGDGHDAQKGSDTTAVTADDDVNPFFA